MMNRFGSWTPSRPVQGILIAGAVLALLVVMVFWAGLPPMDMRPYFVLGVVVLTGTLILIGYIGWHLLFKPLPTGQTRIVTTALKPGYRRVLALLLGLSGLNIIVGGFWDEVWHRKYGIPFGEDLLWRPHLLLYAGFGVVILLAAWGLWGIVRHGRGSLQQRFRRDPIVGFIVLVGAFLVYALPVDPLWHILYGEDISAWSLPHLLLFACFGLITVLAIAIQLSTLSRYGWRPIMRARFADLFVIILGAFFLLVVMQVLVTEWDAGSPVVWRLRPPWLLPAILAAVAGSMGQFLLRATRLAGAATLTGLLALAVRGGLLVLFDFDLLSADPWLAILPGLIAVDLWSGLQWARTGRPAGALSAGLAALAGTALGGFPLINGLFTYPRIDGGNLLPMLVASLVAALAGTWSGVRLGEAVRTVHRPLTGEGEISLPMRFAPAGGLIAALTFIVIFIITARPPV